MRNALKKIGGLFHRQPGKHSIGIDELRPPGDYLDAYSEHTDQRVDDDPHDAIGGMWEELGRLQFDYLRGSGLAPQHALLDIGCGTLRGGRHFIRYLEPGNYAGIDLSEKAIEFAKVLVRDEALEDRRPRLLVNESKDLKFTDFGDEEFDFLLAQSVFTHLKPEHIDECFAHVGRIMKPDASFHFTYFDAPSQTEKTWKNFAYPFELFEETAGRHGLAVESRAAEYDHPRGQRMVRLTRP